MDANSQLITYCKKGDAEKAIELLRSDELNVNNSDDDGLTALMHACIQGNTTIINLLILHTADINFQDKNGLTAIVHAYNNDQFNVVDLLLNHGADLNIQDNDGVTILALSCIVMDKDRVEKFLQFGANPNIPDKKGCYALNYSTPDMIPILIKHHAKGLSYLNGENFILVPNSVQSAKGLLFNDNLNLLPLGEDANNDGTWV